MDTPETAHRSYLLDSPSHEFLYPHSTLSPKPLGAQASSLHGTTENVQTTCRYYGRARAYHAAVEMPVAQKLGCCCGT